MNYLKQNRMLAIFKMLANANRIRILHLIYSADKSMLNVNQIYERMEIGQPTISDHLKLMRFQKIIRAKQNGSNMYYSICEPLAAELIKRMY